MKRTGLKVVEIGPESGDLESLISALVQTVRDGNRLEIYVHYDTPQPVHSPRRDRFSRPGDLFSVSTNRT